MPSHALDQRLFQETQDLITDKNPDEVSARTGADLIDDWLKVLEGTNHMDTVANLLKELRGQLLLSKPDPERISTILYSLAEYTWQIAQSSNVQQQTAGKLENMATALRLFRDKITVG